MLATITLIGFLTAAPLSLSAGEGEFTNAAASVSGSYPSDGRCFDASGKGLSGALQIDAGKKELEPAQSQDEPKAVPVPGDCALV